MSKVAAVLGAGIQGCCAALALSMLGFHVKLFDKSNALFNRASANQEGKIHLGFVYARDPSMITARTMIEHAMRFGPAVEALVGSKIDWEPHLSKRFYVGIHRDSTLTPDEHFTHFNRLQEIYEEVSSTGPCHYLGRKPRRIWNADVPFKFKGLSIVTAVGSEETAVHYGWMRNVIVHAVEHDPGITSFLQHEITDVERKAHSFAIYGRHAENSWKNTADIVVNCLWEGKYQIDRTMNVNHASDWVTRVKFGFVLDSIAGLGDMPSLILTHGPFGDIVNYPYDNSIYVTWYPSCLAYFSQSTGLPPEWEAVCNGNYPQALTERIFNETIASLSEYVPELTSLKLKHILAGSIMGHGKTDISDRKSGLHQRHGIGVEAEEGYYSIFTGKFTSGPANALQLQEMLA